MATAQDHFRFQTPALLEGAGRRSPGRLHQMALVAALSALTLPFLGAEHRLPLLTVYQEFLGLILGLIATLLCLIAGRATLSVPRITGLPLLLIGFALFQWALDFPLQPLVAGVNSLYLLWACCMAVVFRCLADAFGAERFAEWLAWGILAGGLCLALTGILNVAFPAEVYDLPLLSRGGACGICGNFPQANCVADFFWLACLSALYLRWQGRLGGLATFLVVYLLVLLAFATGSRMAYLLWGAVTLWLVARCQMTDDATQRQRGQRLVIALLLIGLLAELSLQAYGLSSGAGRLLETRGRDPVRWSLMQGAWDIFLAHPWFGAGLGAFRDHFAGTSGHAALLAKGYTNLPEHSHNLVLELMVSFGLPGLLALLWFAGRWLGGLPLRAGGGAWLALGLAGVLGFHSMLEYPLWYVQFLGLAAAALSVGDRRVVVLPYGRILKAVAVSVLALLLLAALSLRVLYGQHDAQKRALESQLRGLIQSSPVK